MSPPSFSVVIPTHQRRDTVCDALRALARLEYEGGVELIVVVDGSTDGTAEALKDIECPFPLRVIEQANAGPAAARNAGAAEAAGEILLFLDDDMMCEPDILTHLAASYAEGADAVRGAIPVEVNSRPGFLTRDMTRWSEQVRQREATGRPLGPFDIAGGQLSVRRETFLELGGFDESFTAPGMFAEEDTDFGVRLLKRFRVDFNPAAISHQRYVVTPRLSMDKTVRAAKAEMLFARKHPALAHEVFGLRRRHEHWKARWIYRPLARVPLLPRLLSAAAINLAELAETWPRPLDALVGVVFRVGRGVAYWRTVGDLGGLPTSRRCLVLAYHVVRPEEIGPKLAPYAITPNELERQIDSLARHRYIFVSAADLLACVRDGGGLPPRSVLLTFDDCYSALLEVATRILQPRGIPALAFTVTGLASQSNEWDQAEGAHPLKLLSAEELRELSSLGCDIGSHSRTHAALPELSDEALLEEIGGSADDLERMGLPRPSFFAHPYNYRDRRSIAALEKAGYAAAFGGTGDLARESSERFDLPRVTASSRDGALRFYLRTRWPRLFCRLIDRWDRRTSGDD